MLRTASAGGCQGDSFSYTWIMEMMNRTEGHLLMLTTSSYYGNSETCSGDRQEYSRASIRVHPPQLKSCTLW